MFSPFSKRCIFYEFVMREPIVQCKQGDCEFDVLAKLFRLLGFPGVGVAGRREK